MKLYIIGSAISLLLAPVATAQVVPDTTLPQNSMVSDSGSAIVIDGGTIAGDNLFHSFSEFSLPAGSEAAFNNAVNINNIIARVTGSNISNIDGTIRANGSANLLFLNPNGIAFGNSARLDIGGSFLGSTAEGVVFADGVEFSATPTRSPILTVSVPVGLQFGSNPGNITAIGSVLGVSSDRTLALIGGPIDIESSRVFASGGRIEFGSVASGDRVDLVAIEDGWMLQYPDVSTFTDIQLLQRSTILASGETEGTVRLQGRNITIAENSQIVSEPFGVQPGGDIEIEATDSVTLSELGDRLATLSTLTLEAGDAGNITIRTRRLQIENGASIISNTFDRGNGGTVTIVASESTELRGFNTAGDTSTIFTSAGVEAQGRAGNIRIETDRLLLDDGAIVSANTSGSGDGGDITVTAQTVELRGISSQFSGFRTIVTTQVTPGASGNAGNITINTDRLLLDDGAFIAANTFGTGNGGDLTIRATESVELRGESIDPNPMAQQNSSVSTNAQAVGNAGDITIETGVLTLRDGAQFEARSSGVMGRSGNLNVTVDRLELFDGGRLAVSATGQNPAGTLNIDADRILLSDGAILEADTEFGTEGNIRLNTNSLILRDRSRIRTNATEEATGGNITIDTGILAALENSDITANSEREAGGNIVIETRGIFGTQFRTSLSPNSDITATGATQELQGTVQVNTPDIDATSGLLNLPADPVDVTRLVGTDPCSEGEGSEFTIIGRGGLPPTPSDSLGGTGAIEWMDWIDLEIEDTEERKESQRTIDDPVFREATTWTIAPDGTVSLRLAVPTRSSLSPQNCWRS